MANTLRGFVVRAPAHPDFMVALMLLLAIGMMIMPIPIIVIDMLIGFNLGFAILLLMVALYLSTPLDFSSLPGVILISTVFRLALTIATTRLILAEGDAGSIIHTFGDFVISGNIAVGIVIFLIVTMVQFMVLAKGAERVAEVSARFTLDALPGKQMAIDAELRNSHIDQHEARRRRAALEQESQLHGAMDGAMKFVKGDAIAGLIVICINMLGGISIGLLSKGMSLDEALHQYTLLTIGDALISQIPALLLSITAATIVTRVNGPSKLRLGADIVHQLTASTEALRLAACVLVFMGLVPGFPLPPFAVLAVLFAAASYVKVGPKDDKPAAKIGASAAASAPAPAAVQKQTAHAEALPIALFLAPNLTDSIDKDELEESISRVSRLVSADLGITIPRIPAQIGDSLSSSQFRVDVDSVPVERDVINPGHLALNDDVANIELSGIPFQQDPETNRVWIEERHAAALKAAGIGYHRLSEVLALRLHSTLTRFAQRLVGIQETRQLLARMEQEYPDLVKEVLRTATVPRIAEVLRRLLDEGIPIRNTRLLLEALAEWSEREQNAVLLTEYVRATLKRQICFRYANAHRVVVAFIIERESEEIIRGAVRETAVGPYLVLDEWQSEKLLAQFRQIHATIAQSKSQPVVLGSMDIRRFVRGFLTRNGIDLPVLSYQDLAADFTVQPIGSVKLPKAPSSGGLLTAAS
ncbi:type III secretion protein V [Bradyrhizobium diazoefficiens]|uniref:RhcV protein n=1 Tax=Bradyrhizobium diazoefficiens TaxID=1355477 RepID=A0A0E4BN73_9BRAD|nr:type III secretion system export apparatus subunit SctV [Bradyrhizobium diazoefficiens]MBR0868186.1 type III secretion system export apparatus subunit SctV [Bradyrhizobium diazoefficiens]MBR0892711.1 type III secretion system export apparatus subunit SctV [Bradyrhizobium diazoefficiens]MBR0924381.1 type III secretion system export apparatus subunit SctV [Bradyrhizobium diazoefficiens]WLA66707.1 type III secretion system export apparatus subunit SctV [Bradyrhizobium diazoefficiens]BAR55769.1